MSPSLAGGEIDLGFPVAPTASPLLPQGARPPAPPRGARPALARAVRWLGILLALAAGAGPLSAAEPDPWSCPTWIANAERAYGIPPQLLQAIGRVEIGDAINRGKTGSWMLNIAGRTVAPASLADALDTIILARETSIDVGCLQINLRAHGTTVYARGWLLYPKYNAAYGAWYLASLFQLHGSWGKATAAYHAGSNLERGRSYCRRVAAALLLIRRADVGAFTLTC